ncbi:RNA-binding protein [Tropicibacter oceani]|uniref:RNA-binding protein n=1 Tax=Tropicibacter oceani TaxID=3058420 RepID=A0ABY8QJW3_9RHOB|nr:RNA-binding protein [Tropicibacter oceani]WGW04296.1 RNA-binding protein [Tropicibacter oceani]
MSRGGHIKDREDGPERKCIATGEAQPKSGLIRFVVGPDAQIVPDLAGKLPGRGIYVASQRDALEKASKKGLFARAAKQPVTVPDDLPDLIEKMLAKRLIDLISLARKSGGAVAGYEKVKDWLSKEVARVLIQAEDGSSRGKSKLSTPYGGTYIGWLTADELGMAFGRQSVIHAALGAGGLAPRVVEEAQRLKGVRVGTSDADRAGRGQRKG